MEIAVLVGDNGNIATLPAKAEIHVYQYSVEDWELVRSMPFSIHSSNSLPIIREYLKIVITFLGECRTLVGLSVIGLPYFELEKAGFTIWEIAGSPLFALESIREAETASLHAPVLNIVLAKSEPREVSPGCYSISLKDIQNCNGMVTSKQILFPLLKQLDFHTLEVICSHVPPWLEQQLLIGQLTGYINQITPQEFIITISGEPTYP